MGAFLDLEHQRFERLIVIKRYSDNVIEKSGRQRVVWECLCDCGNKIITRGFSLTSGKTKSCGCIKQETVRQMSINRRMPVEKRIENKKIRARKYHYKKKVWTFNFRIK